MNNNGGIFSQLTGQWPVLQHVWDVLSQTWQRSKNRSCKESSNKNVLQQDVKPPIIYFVCLFVLPDELLQGWKMNTILSEDFPGFSEMKTSPQCRLKLVNLNPNRTYLIKFVPSVGFSIILPKHPSSRASWWLKRPPFNKRMLWSGPPVAKHLPCCHVSLNNNLSNHGRSVLFETEGLCLFLKKEMRN